MQPQNDELAIARMRVLRARQELNGTMDEVLSRLKPVDIASRTFSRITGSHGQHALWISTALTLYRFRGTVMSIMGGLAALKARQEVNRPHTDKNDGVAEMAQHLKEGVSHAREKISAIAETGVRKISKARERAESTTGAAAGLGSRVVNGIKENPVATIIGGLALGVLVGVLLPRRSGAEGESSSFDRLRAKASGTVREVAHNVGARLDEWGVNKENAAEALAKTKEAARGASSQVAQIAREKISRARGQS